MEIARYFRRRVHRPRHVALFAAAVLLGSRARFVTDASAPPSHRPPSKTKRVLIVDDQPKVREVLQAFFGMLEHGHTYEVETARDGAEAILALHRGRFDLILLDLQMPRMGGLEMLRQMHQLGIRVPVVVLTGNPDSKAAGEVLSDGVFAYAPTPVDVRKLDYLVALALSSTLPARRSNSDV